MEDSFLTSRFYDFKKRPFDGINKRVAYQFWPAFESELKRKGLSPVMDLKFNPMPTEPTASFRKVAHDDAVMQARLIAYDAAQTAHLLHGSKAPDINTLKLDPDDCAASTTDRKAIKAFNEDMERQATTANQALGVFTSFTTKSVQNELSYILDDPVNHSRHKIFQLQDYFNRQTPPNVAIGEKIKMEIGDLPQARNYTEILGVANTIRDLQAELILVNPTATLSLSEMVSKLLSKIQDKEFQMLRFQISEWEENRLANLAIPPPPPPLPPTRSTVSSSSSSLMSAGGGSSASSPATSSFSSGGTGGMRLSHASLGTLVPPFVPKPPSVSQQFRPVIDLIQKFHLSMSTIDSSTHGINSVDVIINGAGAGSAQQNLTGNQLPMWGMPRTDFFPPDFRLPQYLQWMSQYDATAKPSGGGGYTKKFQTKDTTHQKRQQRRTSNSESDRSRSDSYRDNSYRGDKSSRGESSTRRDSDGVSNRDKSYSHGQSSNRGDRRDHKSTSSRPDRDQRSTDTNDRSDRKRDRSEQASSLTVDLDEDDDDDDENSQSSDSSHSN